jgi:hypothetical protein
LFSNAALVVRFGEASVPTREFYTALGNQYGMTGVTMMTYGKTEKEDKVWCACGEHFSNRDDHWVSVYPTIEDCMECCSEKECKELLEEDDDDDDEEPVERWTDEDEKKLAALKALNSGAIAVDTDILDAMIEKKKRCEQ